MRVLLIIFFWAITQSLMAQKNTVFLELGGQGGITSLSYERQFNDRTTGLGVRTGIGTSVFEFKPNESDSGSIAGCSIRGSILPHQGFHLQCRSAYSTCLILEIVIIWR
ncbi:hypothetical protein BFP77_08065 [Maribacter sp. 4U21]|uniref:hypothetical protein n=1 Tax=Maribacter sp. 4U21 TaxID=1889779 RepID=UPI000C15A53E|nr:hypothetical protein [Maribacter sp. 4U21]PIB29145.1 hypothetical protein BFP77_08065 [Maribacter sp. 4U21]